jgi:hypothetical protein
LLGCRSTDPQTSVEPIVVDHEKAEVQPPAEASARAEDKPPPADLGVDYDGPVSPEGYRLLEEKDRREPPQGRASIPDLPPEEKERVEQTLATMKEFIRQLEVIHGADYCRAAKETAPTDAWGSKFRVSCKAKFMGIVLGAAGPDRVERSRDDLSYGIGKRPRGNYEGWTINLDVWD